MGKIHRPSIATALSTLAAVALSGAQASAQGSATERATPLFFAANAGQLDPEIRFQARVPGMCASVLGDGFVLELADAALRVRVEGALESARAVGLEPRAGRVHFLTGERPEDWTTGVATYARVRLAGLQPGVDLELHESAGRIEYDLVLASGADASGVVLALEGAERVSIDEQGNLVCVLGDVVLVQRAPVAWQPRDERERRPVACAWRALGEDRFGFVVGGAEPGAPLVVDPVLVYTTHVGGTNADEARGVCADDEGNVYVTGWTRSGNFPLGRLPFDASQKNREGVVFKLSPGGRELLYATYFGGSGDDEGRSIQVDAQGRAFVAGVTASRDFPVAGQAHQRSSGGGAEAFALCLASDGASLVYATYLGGGADDGAEAAHLCPDGRLYVAGTARSRDFPTTYQAFSRRARGGRDVFAALLDPHGALLASTLLGGSEDDEAFALDVDRAGCVYLAGRTASSDFPTTGGAFDRERGATDAFVLKLDAACGTLAYATLLGGSGHDEARGLAVDDQRRAVVCGWTDAEEFPAGVLGTRAKTPGRKDGFVARLSERGEALLASSTIGGSGADEALGVVLDARGTAWVVGHTSSRDFPRTGSASGTAVQGGGDAFLVGIDAATWTLAYSETFGGAGDEVLTAAHIDPSQERLALAGWADDLPLERRGPLAGSKRGPSDALVLELALDAPPAPPFTLGTLGSGRASTGASTGGVSDAVAGPYGAEARDPLR